MLWTKFTLKNQNVYDTHLKNPKNTLMISHME